jgi:GTP-binding protein YchF
MSFKCGIVGLPNVGKSTLFNALTSSNKAQAEFFPFCTIDPNIGIVAGPDERPNKISSISKSQKTINTTITFVDIAGLVKGASKGEGLGNKFLSHIREVDAIVHLTRCFESEKIQNVNKTVDPVRDVEIVETEILLADLESLEKRLEKNKKKNLDKYELNFLEQCLSLINKGEKLELIKKKFDKNLIKKSGLLSLKPKIIVCNVDEKSLPEGNEYSDACKRTFSEENIIVVCADTEDQTTIMFSSEKVLLHASEYSLPSGKLFSSTLHTIILGFRDNKPDFLIRFLSNFFFINSSFSPLLIKLKHCSKKFNSYLSKFFFLFFSNLFSRDSKSANRISVSTISTSLTGSTVLLTFCIFSDSKQRVK